MRSSFNVSFWLRSESKTSSAPWQMSTMGSTPRKPAPPLIV